MLKLTRNALVATPCTEKNMIEYNKKTDSEGEWSL
jgi:hypothetical protein